GSATTDRPLVTARSTGVSTAATPSSVTVPSAGMQPPMTLRGVNTTASATGGRTVSAASCVWDWYVAVIAARVGTVTGLVATGKLALEAPAGMVTESGTVTTLGLRLASVTSTSLVAADVRPTVPVTVLPPTTLSA